MSIKKDKAWKTCSSYLKYAVIFALFPYKRLIIKQKLGLGNKFPNWIRKTDEERIQNMFNRLEHKTKLVVSEKLDGCSATYAIRQHKFIFLKFY